MISQKFALDINIVLERFQINKLQYTRSFSSRIELTSPKYYDIWILISQGMQKKKFGNFAIRILQISQFKDLILGCK